MNRPALRALERADVKTRGTGGNAGQHGSCLARGAKWPQDEHDASPWIRRESYSSQSPVDAVMDPAWNRRLVRRCSILLTFEKLMY
jgi:hypothetical protein